jgi:hypothetical protein
MAAASRARLADDIESGLAQYLELLTEIQVAHQRLGDREPETYDLRAIASIVTDVYRGAEDLFKRIAKEVDNYLPDGESWHSELLDKMATSVPNLRPAVLTSDTVEMLKAYLKFRHLQRNIYGFDLLWPRMDELFRRAPTVITAVSGDLHAFAALLRTLDPPA